MYIKSNAKGTQFESQCPVMQRFTNFLICLICKYFGVQTSKTLSWFFDVRGKNTAAEIPQILQLTPKQRGWINNISGSLKFGRNLWLNHDQTRAYK